jgi:hypothetical protein
MISEGSRLRLGPLKPARKRGEQEMSKGFKGPRFETDISRRMNRGESIPAWRPTDMTPPPEKRAPDPPPPPLDVIPISAAEARAVAIEINEWAKTGHGEIETYQIRFLCQWVLRVTRGAE